MIGNDLQNICMAVADLSGNRMAHSDNLIKYPAQGDVVWRSILLRFSCAMGLAPLNSVLLQQRWLSPIVLETRQRLVAWSVGPGPPQKMTLSCTTVAVAEYVMPQTYSTSYQTATKHLNLSTPVSAKIFFESSPYKEMPYHCHHCHGQFERAGQESCLAKWPLQGKGVC